MDNEAPIVDLSIDTGKPHKWIFRANIGKWYFCQDCGIVLRRDKTNQNGICKPPLSASFLRVLQSD